MTDRLFDPSDVLFLGQLAQRLAEPTPEALLPGTMFRLGLIAGGIARYLKDNPSPHTPPSTDTDVYRDIT